MHDELCSPSLESPASDEPATVFEHAVRMLDHQKIWIHQDDPHDIGGKTAAAAVTIMTMCPKFKYADLILDLFLSILEKEKRPDYATLLAEYVKLREKILIDCTEFIIHAENREQIRKGWQEYQATSIVCALTDFIVVYKPCCRLKRMAWLIPAVAGGVPALSLICYAAEELADMLNDPLEPLKADCLSVGNSWLHRLGIYLLHQCAARRLPPEPALIRLMSLVTPPPSCSIKSGKATRYSDYLANPEPVYYLHEMPPDQAAGTALALELLGEFDANRQGEHFRRVERAAAYYAASVLNGAAPSIKSIQRASGLSWGDSKYLINAPFFRRLVFEQQCRFLLFVPNPDCPECKALAQSFEESETGDLLIQSSESSW